MSIDNNFPIKYAILELKEKLAILLIIKILLGDILFQNVG